MSPSDRRSAVEERILVSEVIQPEFQARSEPDLSGARADRFRGSRFTDLLRRLAIELVAIVALRSGLMAAAPAISWEAIVTDSPNPYLYWDPMAVRRLADVTWLAVYGSSATHYGNDGAILSVRNIEADGAAAVAIEPFGGVVVVLQRDYPQGWRRDFSVMKYDGLTGRRLWSRRTWNSMGPFTKAVAAAVNPRGDVFVIASFSGTDGFGWGTICLDGKDGTVRWGPVRYFSTATKFVGSGEPFALAVDAEGNAIVAGYFTTETKTQLATIKYDGSTGATLWGPVGVDILLPPRPTVCGICIDPPVSLKLGLDSEGGVFVASSSYGGFDNMGNLIESKWVLVKYDTATGQRLWGPIPTSNPGYNQLLFLATAGNGEVAVATSGPIPLRGSFLSAYQGSTGKLLWGPMETATPVNEMVFDGGGDLFFIEGNGSEESPLRERAVVKISGRSGGRIWESGIPLSGSWLARRVAVDSQGDLTVLALDVAHSGARAVGYSGRDGSVRIGPVPIESLDSVGSPLALLPGSSGETILATYGSVRKFARDGAVLWKQSVIGGIDPAAYPRPTAAVIDPRGDVLISGEAEIGVSYLEKIAGLDGSRLWGPIQIPRSSYYSTFLARDRNGDAFVAVGTSSGWTLRKYRGSSGSLIWGPVSPPPQPVIQASALAVDGNGDVWIAGWSYVSPTAWMTFKYSGATGSSIFGPLTLEGWYESSTAPKRIVIDARGDAVVMGKFVSARGENCATIKYSGTTGKALWGPVLLEVGVGQPQSLLLDASGDVLLSAENTPGGTSSQTRIVKYSGTTGEPLWGPVDHSLDAFEPVALAIDSRGDVVFAVPRFNEIDADWFLAKLRGTSGDLVWTESFDSGFGDLPFAVAASGTDLTFVGNAGTKTRIVRYTEDFVIEPPSEDSSHAVCGTAYEATLSPANAVDPVKWIVFDGSLPPGLFLDPFSGRIAGSPEREGLFSFVVAAVDGSAALTFRPLTIDVVRALPNLSIRASRNHSCLLGGYTLSVAEPHDGYLWQPSGETTSTIDVCPLHPTVYSVVVTDGTHCQKLGSIELTAYERASSNRPDPVLPPRRRTSPRESPR